MPAVVYGLGTDTVSVTVPCPRAAAHPRRRERRQHPDQPRRRRRRASSRSPARSSATPPGAILVHVDFIRIRPRRRGERRDPDPPGRRGRRACSDGGLLEQLVFNLTVEAMPGNIPRRRSRSTSSELEIGDQLRVEDIAARRGRHHAGRARHRRRAGRGTARRHRARRGRRGRGRRGRRGRGRCARHPTPSPRTTPATSSRVLRRRGTAADICWWWASAIPATSTRARVTTSAPRSSSCWPRATAAR